jgi:enediyne biosynthesis protein E4
MCAACLATAQTPSPVQFQNVAPQADLRFTLENYPTPEKHLIETMPGGVAAFDFDNDGLTDIFFTNGAHIPSLQKNSAKFHNRLFRNLGGWKFEDVTSKAGLAGAGYSMGVAAGDFDNDGFVDLFVAGVGRNLLYRNRGDGTFEDVTAASSIKNEIWSVAAVWFDADNDGLLDLLVVNYLNWTSAFDRYCGDRQANLRVYCHPQFFEGLPNTLYRNLGKGKFEDITKSAGLDRFRPKSMSAAVADYDGDGRTDIFITSDTQPNLLLRNIDGKRFEEKALDAGVAFNSDGKTVSAMGIDFRDYDNDGRPDIFFTALSNETFPLFRNTGASGFADATFASAIGKLSRRYAGWAAALVDLDNDGWKDIFTANSHVNDNIERFEATAYRQANAVFRNLGGGKFADVSASAGSDFQKPAAHRGAAFADFDNDGRMDVVVTALGAPAELWRNVTASSGHWVTIRLRGARSNRDGIGARTRIGLRHNHMTSAVGYASSSHHGMHFGLGADTQVDSIELVWPSGRTQVLKNVKTNQVLTVTEPQE